MSMVISSDELKSYKPDRPWAKWQTCSNCQRDWPVNPLSEKQWKVALLLAEANTREDIAAILGVSPHTVKNHIDAIYGKLHFTRIHLNNQIGAVLWVLELNDYYRLQLPGCDFCQKQGSPPQG